MQITRELPENVHTIRGHAPDHIRVGDRILRTSFLLSATELAIDWPPRGVEELLSDHFSVALAWRPEIILLGTGTRQRFVAHEIYATILARGVGFEVMDTGAACRTYNVLVGESRRVVAGFLFGAD